MWLNHEQWVNWTLLQPSKQHRGRQLELLARLCVIYIHTCAIAHTHTDISSLNTAAPLPRPWSMVGAGCPAQRSSSVPHEQICYCLVLDHCSPMGCGLEVDTPQGVLRISGSGCTIAITFPSHLRLSFPPRLFKNDFFFPSKFSLWTSAINVKGINGKGKGSKVPPPSTPFYSPTAENKTKSTAIQFSDKGLNYVSKDFFNAIKKKRRQGGLACGIGQEDEQMRSVNPPPPLETHVHFHKFIRSLVHRLSET